jgi:transcriptional regulator with XRE-family HTH domain
MPRPKKTEADYPIPVRRALRKLGANIRDARRRRRISTEIMAERASISRTTLAKIEKGDSGVALGNYAKVLFALGLASRLADLADVREDSLGLELDEEQLPLRIRRSTRKRPTPRGKQDPD